MAQNATQRARMVARMQSRAAQAALAAEERDAEAEPDLRGSGKVEGTAFDWSSSLFLDPETKALYDGGDQEARDIREGLAADWKMRQLAEILTSPYKSATWKLVPGKGDTGEAEDLEEKLRRPKSAGGMSTPIARVISQATSSIIYRRAYFAKGFKLDPVKRDGSVMYSRLEMRPASTCRLLRDPTDGSFMGFEQDIVYNGPTSNSMKWNGLPVPFKAAKSLVFINGLDRDAVSGVSDLEVALWCWRTKRKVMVLWLTFLSAYALPRTLVKHKGDEIRARQAAQMIATLSGGGVGYIDATIGDVQQLETPGAAASVFREMIQYLDSAASGSVQAGFADLTSAAASGRGSFALSTDSRQGFNETREHAADEMADTFTSYAVAPLVRWNYGAQGVVPAFKFDQLAGNDQQIFDLLKALATTQTSALPAEFVNELALHASRILDLDEGKIKVALEEHAAEAKKAAEAAGANPAGQTAAATGAAINGLQAIAKHVAGAAPARPRAAAPAPA